MNVSVALNLAREIAVEHGIGDWKISLSRAKKTLGQTHLSARSITLSRSFIELNDWNEVQEVVLHEIAHALAHEKYGFDIKAHGPEWRTIADDIGVQQIGPIMRGAKSAESKYAGVCPCGTPHSKERIRRGAVYRCTICEQPVEWIDRATGRKVS